MAKRLFVGGLSYTTTSDELRALFSKIGEVTKADVITDKFTNQGKGFGFVEFADDANADKAMKELNGTDFGGRKTVGVFVVKFGEANFLLLGFPTLKLFSRVCQTLQLWGHRLPDGQSVNLIYLFFRSVFLLF